MIMPWWWKREAEFARQQWMYDAQCNLLRPGFVCKINGALYNYLTEHGRRFEAYTTEVFDGTNYALVYVGPHYGKEGKRPVMVLINGHTNISMDVETPRFEGLRKVYAERLCQLMISEVYLVEEEYLLYDAACGVASDSVESRPDTIIDFGADND